MKLRFACILSVFSCLCAGAAVADWQYPGHYLGDGWYLDDGSRFVMSFRGGGALQRGSVVNEIGSMSAEYYTNPGDGMVVSVAYYENCVSGGGCGDFVYAGLGDLADLPANKNLSVVSFAAGVSVGWTVPNFPQWRMELGWDHISESEYSAAPLFSGELELKDGSIQGIVVNAQSGGAHSSITTDIISAMAFYDFFDGIKKPVREFIPYFGFGIGYASSTTVLNLSDLYGDLSLSVDLGNYGVMNDYKILQFYTSEKDNANIAGLAAFGFSYGITDAMFLDLGARVTYLPKVKWALSNEDGTKHRDWYSVENIIYASIMAGIRFEF
ncbi:MAG: hypothetical protein LBF28_00065 [Rickettsiales bacterium]|jgi:hypothetical protein|nr:hypothetical protein [Rickettsiales bacterium]